MYDADLKADKVTRTSTGAVLLIIVAIITVALGSRNAAKIGYQHYLKDLSKRKNGIAKSILRQVMKKKRQREASGSEAQKIESILEEIANDDILERKDNECNFKKILVTYLPPLIILGIIIILSWKFGIFEVMDVFFMLSSVVAPIPIVPKMPCGRKKIVWNKPNCCISRDEVEVNEASLDSYYATFLNEESATSSQKKICCQEEVRQILGFVFGLGLGVIWYIFREDYEHVWVLHMLISCCYVTGLGVISAQSTFSKFQGVVVKALLAMLPEIFLIYITPLFTSDGRSFLISDFLTEPGKKGNVNGINAFALYFPDYFASTDSTCMGLENVVMLGTWDLYFAAFICTNIYVFELVKREGGRDNPPCFTKYEVVSVVTYCVSLIAAVLVMIFTGKIKSNQIKIQSALAFIVPCLLGGIFITAAFRGEVKLLWKLDYGKHPPDEELIATVRQELIEFGKKRDANELTSAPEHDAPIE